MWIHSVTLVLVALMQRKHPENFRWNKWELGWPKTLSEPTVNTWKLYTSLSYSSGPSEVLWVEMAAFLQTQLKLWNLSSRRVAFHCCRNVPNIKQKINYFYIPYVRERILKCSWVRRGLKLFCLQVKFRMVIPPRRISTLSGR